MKELWYKGYLCLWYRDDSHNIRSVFLPPDSNRRCFSDTFMLYGDMQRCFENLVDERIELKIDETSPTKS